jgi:predicted metalloprotease with PDZ domain
LTPIRYRIALLDAGAHLFEVRCTVAEPDPAGQSFRLPAWIPGSYLIREFARNFVAVRAESGGRALPLRKTAKDAWQVDPCNEPLTLVAEVYANDLSVRAAYLDTTRAYFNGPSVFVWPVGQQDRPCEVDIVAPSGPTYARWRVATSLPRCGAAPYGFGVYRAADYDELIDHPVEMGEFDLVSFEAGGARHDVAVAGRHRGDLPRVAGDLQKICTAQIDLFAGASGGRAPFDYYLFQVFAAGTEVHGGLEHRASTSLLLPRNGLPETGVVAIDDDYRSWLGVASHEYFHAWNVKRIKPAAFVPYDLTRENHTEQLWIFEGFTSYYDDLMLMRGGVVGVDDYLELLGRTITRHLRTPGRNRQSVAASSFDAWIKYYRQDENSPNAIVSYYVTGSLIALALDLTLRLGGKCSLDDVMRTLWQRYGRTGRGVPEGVVERLASELAGADLAPFFRDHVHGTVELPLARLLAEFAVVSTLRQADGATDKGGKPGKSTAPRTSIGAVTTSGGELRLKHVFTGGPASLAGLSAGDALVAIDDLRANADLLERVLKTRRPGDVVQIAAFRRDELMRFSLTLEAAPQDTCWLSLAGDVSSGRVERRKSWLTGRAED